MTETSHEQHEALFELEHPPPIRKGSRDYLTQLGALDYSDDLHGGCWAFWALAPVERRWTGSGHHLEVDHVWLLYRHDRLLYQALVDITTGEILRRRAYDPEHQDRKVPT